MLVAGKLQSKWLKTCFVGWHEMMVDGGVGAGKGVSAQPGATALTRSKRWPFAIRVAL